MAAPRWDIACRVVDHFGDVGIAWRLARQLAGSGCAVRLAVDRLEVLARIEPRLDARMPSQTIDGVELVPWTTFEAVDVVPAATVVELLGCGLPTPYLDALEARHEPAVWIDFEHLTAERWVDGFHGLPSPHPTRALVKHFFYPGFGPRTGGLLIEPEVDIAQPPGRPDARTLSLFAYPHAPVADLLDVLASGACGRWTVIVPGDALRAAVDAWHGADTSDRLSIRSIPFCDQDGYDRLLAACDVNFVRGEDSFVRAQNSGRPMVWQAYRQADRLHLDKLAAFEARYGEGLADPVRQAQRRFWMAWNGSGDDVQDAFLAWWSALPALAAHAVAWRRGILAGTPAVERLIAFAEDRRGATGGKSPALC